MAIDSWLKLDAGGSARRLKEINPSLEPAPLDPAKTAIRTQLLPFYRHYELLELTDFSTTPGARKYVIYKQGDVNVINWTNQPIYDTNEKSPIILTEENVTEYAKFFFNYVRGRHGRFLVIETIDDIRWQIEPPVQGRKVIQEMLEPVTLVSHEADGTFNLDAFMVFKDSMFKTKIHVKKDGLVSMSSEELKIEGIPVMQDTAA